MVEAQQKRKLKPIFKILIPVIIILIFVFLCIFLTGPVNRFNKTLVDVEITQGTSTSKIGDILKEKKLIRSKTLFKIYSKLGNTKSLQAGVYQFSQNMSLKEIVDELGNGSNYNPNLVVLTFKEGERLTDYAEVIAKGTNHTYEDVINKLNDRTYLNELINDYWFLTNDILDSDIYYPLEGYLSPNTYHFKDKDVEIEEVVKKLLDQEEKELDKYKNELNGKSIHDIITMASVVELEGTNSENKKMITGIFYNRLGSGFNMGSDVTTYYALQRPMTTDLTSQQFATVNPYNTRSTTMIGKLPIGPISNPSDESIEATIHYTDNDYLFFVADKNGKIYYSRNNAEHEKTIKQIKDAGNWIW